MAQPRMRPSEIAVSVNAHPESGRDLGADAVVIADEQGSLTFVPMAEALPKRAR